MEEIEKIKDKCEFCGTTKNVDHIVDPYELDIYGEEELVYICGDCYDIRLGDI